MGADEEPDRVDDGAMTVVEKERRHENLGTEVVVVVAIREYEKSEPDGGALHEEPGQGWRDSGAPAGAVVLAIRSGEKQEGDYCRWCN